VPSGLGLDDPLLEDLEAHVAVHPEQLVGTGAEHVAVPGLHGHAKQVLHERDVEAGALEVGVRRARPALDEARLPEPLRDLMAAERHVLAARRVAVDEDDAQVADDPPVEAARQMAGVRVEGRAQVGGRRARHVPLRLMGVQAQREDLVVVGARRRAVVGHSAVDAPHREAAGAQRGRRQRRVAREQVVGDRLQKVACRIDPRHADVEGLASLGAAHGRQAPPAALDPDRREVQLEVELGPRQQRRVRLGRPERHPAGAELHDLEAQRLPEEPRARRRREGRQRAGGRVAGALTALGVGHPGRVGHEQEPDPRERPARRRQAADVADHGPLAGARGAASGRAHHHDLADGRHEDVGREDDREPEALGRQVDRLGLEPDALAGDLEREALAEVDAAALARA
jgi:hypothetical protein